MPAESETLTPSPSQDYDCFYAQVYENKNPALKSKPLGIKQKNILATCNYNARARGVRKLMLITEARKACPELVIIEGEDLTPFRDMSKTLFNFIKSHSWNNKVEKLGFDEVFMGKLLDDWRTGLHLLTCAQMLLILLTTTCLA